MDNKKHYIWIGVIVVVLVVGLIAWNVGKPPAAPAQPAAGTQGQNASGAPGTAVPAGAPSAAGTPSSGTAAPKAAKITMISPGPGSQWVMGVQNTIQWSQAAGALDGTITLVDASTGAIAGWIQQHISPHQATFPWKTGNVLISQTSGQTKDVLPGSYRIVLAFNSPNIPTVTGPVFAIISPAEVQIPAATVTIHGATFSASSLIIQQGTKLTFVNQDARSYEITVSSRVPAFMIATSTSLTLDTSILSPGDYVFYSSAYPLLHLAVTTK